MTEIERIAETEAGIAAQLRQAGLHANAERHDRQARYADEAMAIQQLTRAWGSDESFL